MKILLYDVETANTKITGSICAVGWLLLENDQISDSGYSLINPRCPFAPYNVKIHGITENDVSDAPCFADYWNSTLSQLMTSSLVVAHNAGFDLSQTEQALYNAHINDPGIDYFDSLRMFQNLFMSDCYKLPFLAETFFYTYSVHNALEDVKALYHVLKSVQHFLMFDDLPTMLIRSKIAAENTLSNSYLPRLVDIPKAQYHPHDLSRCREDVDICDHLLSGLRICITGDVPGYERADLERIIKQHDGRMTGSVSSKTDYLVVGCYEGYADGFISTKQKTALDVIEKGGKVRIISPDEFFSMIKQES